MPVVQLQPGSVLKVPSNQITGTVQVYRSNQSYDSPGCIGWVPTGGSLHEIPLFLGTATFAVNSASGMIANASPSKVQVLWDNARDVFIPTILENKAMTFLETARVQD